MQLQRVPAEELASALQRLQLGQEGQVCISAPRPGSVRVDCQGPLESGRSSRKVACQDGSGELAARLSRLPADALPCVRPARLALKVAAAAATC